jgi:hypothetical protein
VAFKTIACANIIGASIVKEWHAFEVSK